MSIKQRLKKRTFNKYNHYTEVEWEIKKLMAEIRRELKVFDFKLNLGTHWQPIARKTWG